MRGDYNRVLSTPIEADNIGVLVDTNILVKPKYRPIHRPGQYIG